MGDADKMMLDEIMARYHYYHTEEKRWPSKAQVALDVGYLVGLIKRLNGKLEEESRRGG